MKYILSILLSMSVFLVVACTDTPKEEPVSSAKTSKPLQRKIQSNPPSAQPTITLTQPSQHGTSVSPLGIVVDDGKIIIDTRQTKAFLQGLSQQMDKGFKRIEKNLRKEQISSPNETGIIITDTSIQVDFNQTKNFMEKWIKSMESVAKEIDHTMEEIEKSLPKR